jgi:hypothetical protein
MFAIVFEARYCSKYGLKAVIFVIVTLVCQLGGVLMMRLIMSNPTALLAICLTVLSVLIAGHALNSESALFLPDTAYKLEAIAAIWFSVAVVASLMFFSGGHGKRLYATPATRRHTARSP